MKTNDRVMPVLAVDHGGEYDFLANDDDDQNGAEEIAHMPEFVFDSPIEREIDGKTHEALVKRLGSADEPMNLLEVLGKGKLGIAYALPDGRVAKITRDASEAQSSLRLVGEHLKTVAEIYDVFEIPCTNGKPIWAIVQEKLAKPDAAWAQLAILWYYFRSDPTLEEENPLLFRTPLSKENIDAFAKWAENSDMRQMRFGTKGPIKRSLLQWMRTAADELAAHGVKYSDLHDKNIMKRANGEHVIIDLGQSISAPIEIPKLKTEARMALMSTAAPAGKRVLVNPHSGSKITRSRLGVGKEIGGEIYLHRQYEKLIPDQKALKHAKSFLPKDFAYNVVKFDLKDPSRMTFFRSPDFDTADEPAAGEAYTVRKEGIIQHRDYKSIWHHKWCWVGDDYKGFDVDESFDRSRRWIMIPNLDTSVIGNPDRWAMVVPYIPPPGTKEIPDFSKMPGFKENVKQKDTVKPAKKTGALYVASLLDRAADVLSGA